jgi:Fur family transcriptional regulator, peroxide stress response regulator
MDRTDQEFKEVFQTFEASCKRAGLRLTHQRLEVFHELARSADHPGAETLHQRLRRSIPTLSLDTVYRTLATLAGHGLINKVDTIESQARFEATIERHHHLICSSCKEIVDFQWGSIDAVPVPEAVQGWGRIDHKNVVVYGICTRCL